MKLYINYEKINGISSDGNLKNAIIKNTKLKAKKYILKRKGGHLDGRNIYSRYRVF